MSLSLKEVYDKVNAMPDRTVGYVYDAPIHYVVLNNADAAVDMDIINKFQEIYDQIEKSTGPGVVVTMGSGSKVFCQGFSLPYWGKDVLNPVKSISANQAVLSKILTLGLPTMAVMNGHAYAGGLILGLAHDFRIMTSDSKKRLCLSEINLGFAMPRGYGALVGATIPAKAFRELALGAQITPQEAMKEDVVDALYDSPEDCEKQIKAFAKKYAKVGVHRAAIKRNKEFYYADVT